LSALHGKLLINSALGFDTFLVMRHGLEEKATREHAAEPAAEERSDSHEGEDGHAPAPGKLGCYFCNDIVAATNSQKDRSLDQQCTVTRPGLSFMAAAMAVELMVALIHRTDGDAVREGGPEAAPEIPHQIRGSLAGFTQFTPYVSFLSQFIACFLRSSLSGWCCFAADSGVLLLHGLLPPRRRSPALARVRVCSRCVR
jgi:ubiquitin-like modifier-activating enzyme ATG7